MSRCRLCRVIVLLLGLRRLRLNLCLSRTTWSGWVHDTSTRTSCVYAIETTRLVEVKFRWYWRSPLRPPEGRWSRGNQTLGNSPAQPSTCHQLGPLSFPPSTIHDLHHTWWPWLPNDRLVDLILGYPCLLTRAFLTLEMHLAFERVGSNFPWHHSPESSCRLRFIDSWLAMHFCTPLG